MGQSEFFVDLVVFIVCFMYMYMARYNYLSTTNKWGKLGHLTLFCIVAGFLWAYTYATIGIDLATVIAQS